MTPKIICLVLFIFTASTTARPQGILKKMKEKISGTPDKKADNGAAKENEKTAENSKNKVAWCDTEPGIGGENGNASSAGGSGPASNKASYSLAYTSPANFSIMYDESRLGVNGNKNNYRLILKQKAGNKTQFVIVDNGKITATVAALSKDDILGGFRQPLDGLNNGVNESDNAKYLVAENTTSTIASQSAKTATTPQTINANQVSQAYEMMKNTDEYKKMSPEEKQKMEETMKQMPQMANVYNNSGAGGKTITTPEIKGGTYSFANGYYNIIVKGKSYGRFMGQPQLKVSEDEANVYIIAPEDKGKANFIVNDKKIPLATSTGNYMAHTGYLVMSPDGKKAAFAEIKQLSASEQEEIVKAAQTGAPVKQNFIITKSDGTTYPLVRTDGGDKFRVMNSGTLLYINVHTGEVVADGKTVGEFNTGGTEELNSGALLFGNDISKIFYYSENGSLNYLDGSKKDMGILFPQVLTENGKNYITWFRKCKNAIYIGKFEF